MGTWNGTCGISRLPICDGDAVRAYAIALHPPTFGWDAHTYEPDSFASPIALPVRATYGGYGDPEQLVEDETTALLVRRMNELHAAEKLRIEDAELPATLEELLSLVREGRVEALLTPKVAFSESEPAWLRLSLALVDERIYAATLAAIRACADFDAELRMGGEIGPKTVAAAADAVVEKPGFAWYREAAAASESLRVQLAEQWDFDAALGLLRCRYAPPAAVGSQSRAFSMHAAVAATILRIAEAAT